MRSYIQFVTVPTGDSPGTCVMLHHDNQRYLLGHIAEGTYRACNELGLSLRKVSSIMISGQTTRETTGGLLGILLTLADATAAAKQALRLLPPKRGGNGAVASAKQAGKQEPENRAGEETMAESAIDIYGPPNLLHSIAAARKFIFRKATRTTVCDLNEISTERNQNGDWLPRVMDVNADVFSILVKPQQHEARGQTDKAVTTEEEIEANNLVRTHVVNDMFNSKWRLDTLVEKPLCEVQLPAKIWVRNPQTKDLELYRGPISGHYEKLPDPFMKVFVRNPWPAAMIATLPPTQPKPEVLSYVVRGRKMRGKFLVKKATELGVKPGPIFRELSEGRSVQLDDGRTIHPEQVLAPDIQAGGFAILDIPSHEYVEPLLAREELHSEQIMAGVDTLVWILGEGVSKNEALQEFIRKHPEAQHIISSSDHNANALVAQGAAESAIKLAQIDQEHFPIPYYDDVTTPQTSFRRSCGFYPKEADSQAELFSLPNVMLARPGLKFQLDPKRIVLEDEIVKPLDTLGAITTLQSREIIEMANEARQASLEGPLQQEMKDWHARVPWEDAEIITLGTGSAMPSKYRNVSATLVRVPGCGSYLLDAGENTMGQLQRVYKPDELVEVLRDLRMIWISHGHADHHLGTVSVIKAWHDVVHGKNSDSPPVSPEVVQNLLSKCRKEAGTKDWRSEERPKYLSVIGNHFLIDYLYEISLVENFGYEHVLPMTVTSDRNDATNQSYGVAQHLSVLLSKPKIWKSELFGSAVSMRLFGIKKVIAIPVEHCNGARALCLHFSKGTKSSSFSVAYSGDCRPSSTFAKAAKGATVLIHEATFDDELKGEARAKKHSTVQEAIGVASLMQAKSLILTHFSQRYQKIPVVDNVWGRTEAVKQQIEKEAVEADVEHEAKGPGAGDNVDEVAADEPVLPAPASETNAEAVPEAGKNLDDLDAMDTSDSEPETTAAANTSPSEMKILFAFDYMRVKVGKIPLFQAYRPALAKLFETMVDEENRKRAANGEAAALAADLKRQNSAKKAKTEKKNDSASAW